MTEIESTSSFPIPIYLEKTHFACTHLGTEELVSKLKEIIESPELIQETKCFIVYFHEKTNCTKWNMHWTNDETGQQCHVLLLLYVGNIVEFQIRQGDRALFSQVYNYISNQLLVHSNKKQLSFSSLLLLPNEKEKECNIVSHLIEMFLSSQKGSSSFLVLDHPLDCLSGIVEHSTETLFTHIWKEKSSLIEKSPPEFLHLYNELSSKILDHYGSTCYIALLQVWNKMFSWMEKENLLTPEFIKKKEKEEEKGFILFEEKVKDKIKEIELFFLNLRKEEEEIEKKIIYLQLERLWNQFFHYYTILFKVT